MPKEPYITQERDQKETYITGKDKKEPYIKLKRDLY